MSARFFCGRCDEYVVPTAEGKCPVCTKYIPLIDPEPSVTPPALPDEAGEMVRRLRDKSTHILAVGPEAVDLDTVRLLKEAASLIERLAPRWIPVGANDPTRQVAWIDNQARYVGIILDDRQKFILKLPPQKGST